MTTLLPRLTAQARLGGENERTVGEAWGLGRILLCAVLQVETLHRAPILLDQFTGPGALISPQQPHTSHGPLYSSGHSPGVLPDGEAQLE